MRNISIALVSAATCLLPFVAPASAGLGHPTGCASCEPVEIPAPTEDYSQQGVPFFGPLLGMGVPARATALAPEKGVVRHPLAKRRHTEGWRATYPRE
jgi:hypothetical protein